MIRTIQAGTLARRLCFELVSTMSKVNGGKALVQPRHRHGSRILAGNQNQLAVLNDKNGTIFNLKYGKGFLILVSGKGMEILYYFKPFLQGIVKKDRLITSYSFWKPYLKGRVWSRFPRYDSEVDMETVAQFLR